jgi:hypothetical protein
MNKFVNSVLLFLCLITFFMTVVVGRDLPISFLKTTGQYLPYKEVFFIGAALTIFTIGGRRSVQRWMGLFMIKNVARYQWNEPVGKERKSRAVFYLVLEGFVHLVLAFMMMSFTKYAFPVFIALTLLGIDHFIYALVGKIKNVFRIGITKTAVVLVDRDVRVLYFSGLRKVSVFQKEIFFDYIKDLTLEIPSDAVDAQHRNEFKTALENQLDLSRVYIDESFKKY